MVSKFRWYANNNEIAYSNVIIEQAQNWHLYGKNRMGNDESDLDNYRSLLCLSRGSGLRTGCPTSDSSNNNYVARW
jgi:hypothetical protein